MSAGAKPLKGFTVVNLGLNLPGPLVAHRLGDLGARVVKIEPPSGDALNHHFPEYYKFLSKGQKVSVLDLKTPEARAKLDVILKQADLAIIATRGEALKKLGLDWKLLHRRFPKLHVLSIVGFGGKDRDEAGHDLTYQARAGTLSWTPERPLMPWVFLADHAGAAEAVLQASTLLMGRLKKGVRIEVGLSDALEPYTHPLKYGMTGKGQTLCGELPGYNLYPSKDGWIGVAALEKHFWRRLVDALDVDENASYDDLRIIFKQKTSAEWEKWGRQHDIPIAEVRRISNERQR